MAQFRAITRIDSTYPTARVRDALMTALFTVTAELDSWARTQTARGVTTLADSHTSIDASSIDGSIDATSIEATSIDNVTAAVHWFRVAVYSYAKAHLVDTYRDVDTTAFGARETAADKIDEQLSTWRAQYRTAVSAVQGNPRVRVTLI
ncbi:head completion/stabilization protein [Ostreibacterium oceani]|nr:head completion/stabilization protein [Ostreibacterium oceani]